MNTSTLQEEVQEQGHVITHISVSYHENKTSGRDSYIYNEERV